MSETVDYVVIGSGSAGSVIAAELSKDPAVTVRVLEAGGTDEKYFYRRPGGLGLVYQVPQLKAAADWGYKTIPQPGLDGREMPYTRGRIVGGCSTVNGMLYIRGHRANYDRWARDLGCEGWSYDEVLPLFKACEGHQDGASAYHGGDGPLRVSRQAHVSPVSHAFNESGAKVTGVPLVDDFNGAEQEGLGIYQQTAWKRRRSSASVAFLRPALATRKNLSLTMGALVSRIVIEHGRAVGVAYRVGETEHVVRVNREVILSAGAVGSPQILQLSGIGPAEHLRAHGIDVVLDQPAVGDNLHDHLYTPIRFHADKTGHTSTAGHFLAGMAKDFFFNKGWFADTFLEGGGFLRTTPEQTLPDLQYFLIPWAYPEPNEDIPEKGVIDKRPSFTVLAALLYPKSRGTIRLRSSDPKAHPLIDPAFLKDPADERVLLKGLRWAREFARTAPLSTFVKAEAYPGDATATDDQLRAHMRLTSRTVYHPVGTCRMGGDAASVVDPQLRVRGLTGLRVADASIIPEIIGGNTNAPSIMIGAKAAQLILGG